MFVQKYLIFISFTEVQFTYHKIPLSVGIQLSGFCSTATVSHLNFVLFFKEFGSMLPRLSQIPGLK